MKKRLVPGFCMGLFLFMLAGCGSGAGRMSDSVSVTETMAAFSTQDNTMEMGAGIYEAVMEMADLTAAENEMVEEGVINRKLIKTVSMNVETESFDELTVKLKQRITELGGYIEATEVRGNSYNSSSNRRADMTIRVPGDKLDEFVNEVAESSNITWKSENVEDITLNYVDVESRKRALEIEQERLLELLEIAESVEDIIAIESRLSEVRYEMQSYTSQLLVYDNQVDYSTIYLNIREVERLTPQAEPGMFERIATGLSDNMRGAIKLLENIVVTVIVLIPYGAILIGVIAVIVFVCKAISKSEKRRKAKLSDHRKEEN